MFITKQPVYISKSLKKVVFDYKLLPASVQTFRRSAPENPSDNLTTAS